MHALFEFLAQANPGTTPNQTPEVMEVTDAQSTASDSQGAAKKQSRKPTRSKTKKQSSSKPADTTQSESANGDAEAQSTSKGYEYSLPECKLSVQSNCPFFGKVADSSKTFPFLERCTTACLSNSATLLQISLQRVYFTFAKNESYVDMNEI